MSSHIRIGRKKTNEIRCRGSLFVVGTPIGNIGDITFRAVKTLSLVGLVVAEDTRLTGRLLRFYGIKTRLLSMNEHNESRRIPKIIGEINSNINVALVSSAGTPLISDPGFKLLLKAIDNSIKIIPVPGVSAVVTSVSVAGLPTDAFIFLGFPARKKGKRLRQLRQAAFANKTLVFYESPKRIVAFLHEIIQVMGDRHIVLSREMTKIHEEFIRGSASSVLARLKIRRNVRGECTLLISGDFVCGDVVENDIMHEIKEYLLSSDIHSLDLSRIISGQYSLSKNVAYNMILKVKKSMNN